MSRMITFRRLSGFVVSLVFVHAALVCSVSATDYTVNKVEELNGLQVNCMVQDRCGLLWFGTTEGIISFDGYYARSYNGANSDHNRLLKGDITALLVDRNNNIWIGTNSGLIGLFKPEQHSVRSFPIDDNDFFTMPTPPVLELFFDKENNVIARCGNGKWALFDRIHARFDSSLASPRSFHQRSSAGPAFALTRGDGSLWFCLDHEAIIAVNRKDGSLLSREIPVDHDNTRYTWSESWCVRESEKSYLLGIWRVGLFRYSVETRSLKPLQLRSTQSTGTDIVSGPFAFSGKDIMWIAVSPDGLLEINKKNGQTRLHHVHSGALPDHRSSSVTNLYFDTNNLLWITTSEGVFTLPPAADTIVNIGIPQHGSQFLGNVLDFAPSASGDVWVASLDGLYRWDGESLRKHNIIIASSAGSETIRCSTVLETRNGNLFIGTLDHGILMSKPGSDSFDQLVQSTIAKDLLEDDRGTIWVATVTDGLRYFSNDSKELLYWGNTSSGTDAIASDEVTGLLPEDENTIWVGFAQRGISRIRIDDRTETNFRNHYALDNHLADDRVYSLHFGDGNTIWIGTANGMSRYNTITGIFSTYLPVDDLASSRIFGIATARNGRLWLTTPRGLFKYDPSSSLSVPVRLSHRITTGEFMPGAAWQDKDGTAYFGTEDGFIQIQLADQELMPSSDILVTNLAVAGDNITSRRNARELTSLELDHDRNTFSIEFVVAEYSAPSSNSFRYKLEGFDSDWQSGLGKAKAGYSHLPPGKYTFRYGCTNSFDQRSEEHSISVTVVPPFWTTFGFRASIAALIAALIAAATYGVLRLRTLGIERQRNALIKEVDERRIAEAQLRRYQTRLQTLAVELTIAEEKERRRIAGVLHDHIGQVLLMSKAKLDQFESNVSSEMAAELKPLRSLIDRAVRDTRSLTVEVSPPSLHKFGLETAIESLVDKLSKEHGFVSVFERGTKGNLGANVSILLYQSVRELLINVVKHACASKLKVFAGRKGDGYKLTISDNGKGFDVEEILSHENNEGTYGLFSIEQRMESIGGKMSIHSEAGKGTTVELSIPVSSNGD